MYQSKHNESVPARAHFERLSGKNFFTSVSENKLIIAGAEELSYGARLSDVCHGVPVVGFSFASTDKV